MPRRPRILSSTGIYHIVLRSVNQHIIFEEESDYQKFLFMLADSKETYDIDIFAYCLMDNHIHLLLHADSSNLSSFFQSLGTRFVRWYNNKYLRSGHLFQDRFYSQTVTDDEAFLSTLLYIHNNPVKANVCRYPSEYRWSSFNAFYGQKTPLLNLSFSYEIAGTRDLLLQYFSSDSSAENDIVSVELIPPIHFLTDEKALAVFKEITGVSNTSEVGKFTKSERNTFIRRLHESGLTKRQIARFMDVSVSTVKRLQK